MNSDIKERYRIDREEAYDIRLDENIAMLRDGRLRRSGKICGAIGSDGRTRSVITNVSYPVKHDRPFAGRVESVKEDQKNQWAAGFGYGALFVIGVGAFMALMLF